jgi:signal transduction histidine kinase
VVDVCEQGRVRRQIVASHDPIHAALAAELAGLEIDWNRPHLGHEALDAGRSVLVSDTTDEFLQAMAQTPHHLELLRRLEVRSMMAVPIVGRDRVLGTITFLSSDLAKLRMIYGAHDLRFANELAQRTALALDNARLFREAQRAVAARARNVMAIVSHDLRNPLTTILMTTDLLLSAVPNDRRRRDRKHAGDAAGARAVRMDRLVRDLLDFAERRERAPRDRSKASQRA